MNDYKFYFDDTLPTEEDINNEIKEVTGCNSSCDNCGLD